MKLRGVLRQYLSHRSQSGEGDKQYQCIVSSIGRAIGSYPIGWGFDALAIHLTVENAGGQVSVLDTPTQLSTNCHTLTVTNPEHSLAGPSTVNAWGYGDNQIGGHGHPTI